MLKNLPYIKKVVLSHALVCSLLVMLSCVGLIFNEWVLIVSMAICGIISTVNSFLLVKSGDLTSPEGTSVYFIIFTFVRFILMIIGFVASALLVHFTMPDDVNKYRYLLVALAGVPYIITPVILSIVRKG